jgi:hypothetical protein
MVYYVIGFPLSPEQSSGVVSTLPKRFRELVGDGRIAKIKMSWSNQKLHKFRIYFTAENSYFYDTVMCQWTGLGGYEMVYCYSVHYIETRHTVAEWRKEALRKALEQLIQKENLVIS